MGSGNPPSPIIFGTGVGKIIPSTSAGVLTTDSSGNISSTATTGSGSVVLATAPTISNPVVGTQATSDNSTKAASTAYVTTAISNAIAGVNPAVAVQAATTSSSDTTGYTYNNGVSGIGATLTAGSNNVALTVDGYTFTAIGQRLLVKNNSTAANNGVYSVTQVQASLLPVILTRALDYDAPSDINNTGAIPVVNGTVNGTTQWVQTAQVNTVGTDPLTFVLFTQNPAVYLQKANNLSDVSSTSTSFANISPMTTVGDIIYEAAGPAPARLPIGSSGQILTVTAGIPSWQPAGAAGAINMAVITDTQASGTAGGGSTANTWIARNLNTLTDPQSIVVNSASFTGTGGTATDIQLPAGTYYIHAASPFYNTGAGIAVRFYNTTDAAVAINGATAPSPYVSNFQALCTGIFTIASQKTFQLQYYVGQAISVNGLGNQNTFPSTPEVYTMITIQKIA